MSTLGELEAEMQRVTREYRQYPKTGYVDEDTEKRMFDLRRRLVALRRDIAAAKNMQREEDATEERFAGKDVDKFAQQKLGILSYLTGIGQGLCGLARTYFARMSKATTSEEQEAQRNNIRRCYAAQEQVRHCAEGVIAAPNTSALRQRLNQCTKLDVVYRGVEDEEANGSLESSSSAVKSVAEGRSMWRNISNILTRAYVVGQSVQLLESILTNSTFLSGDWTTNSLPECAEGVAKTVAYTASLGMVVFMMDVAARMWTTVAAWIGGVVVSFWNRVDPDRSRHEHLPKLTFEGRVGASAQEFVQVSAKSRSAQTFMSVSTVFLVAHALALFGLNLLWLVSRQTYGPVFEATRSLSTFLQATTKGVGNPLAAVIGISFAMSAGARPAVEALTMQQWSTAMLVQYLPYYGMLEATAVSFANADIAFKGPEYPERFQSNIPLDLVLQATEVVANYGKRVLPRSMHGLLYDITMPGMAREPYNSTNDGEGVDFFVQFATEGLVEGEETRTPEEEAKYQRDNRALRLKFEGTTKEQYAAVIKEMVPIVSSGQNSTLLGFRDSFAMPRYIQLLRATESEETPLSRVLEEAPVMVVAENPIGRDQRPFTNMQGALVVWTDPDTQESYRFADVTNAFEQLPEFMNFVGRTVAENAPLIQKLNNRLRYGKLTVFQSFAELGLQALRKKMVPFAGLLGFNEEAVNTRAEIAIASSGPYAIATSRKVAYWKLSNWMAVFNGAVTRQTLEETEQFLTLAQRGSLVGAAGSLIVYGALAKPVVGALALYYAMEAVKYVISQPVMLRAPNIVDEALKGSVELQMRYGERPYGAPENAEELSQILRLGAKFYEWLGATEQQRQGFMINVPALPM